MLVYIGFGSVGDKKNVGEMIVLVIKVLKFVGKWGIINIGGSGMNYMEEIVEDILFVKDIFYEWLFFKMFVVVYYGGVGIMVEGFWVGVLSIIVFYGND